jgi:hypothetical protein
MRSVMVPMSVFAGTVTIAKVKSSPSLCAVQRSQTTAMASGLPSLGVITCCSVFVGVISLPSLKVDTTTRPRARANASRNVGSSSMVSARAWMCFMPLTGSLAPRATMPQRICTALRRPASSSVTTVASRIGVTVSAPAAGAPRRSASVTSSRQLIIWVNFPHMSGM